MAYLRYLLLSLAAAVTIAGCAADPGATECSTGIVCPEGTSCAAIQAVCIVGNCGNGLVDTGEACDDGDIEAGDGCSPSCKLESCGDGAVVTGERCDDGNTDSGDGCSADCLSIETCGNNIRDVTEACDDGNTDSGDGCSADCKSAEVCGNGIKDINETCDDGNTVDGDACSSNCEALAGCGNGNIDVDQNGIPVEECDDGNTNDLDGCRNSCRFALCGDGVAAVEASGGFQEECDGGQLDGSTPIETATCNLDCTMRACGDAKVNQTAGEQCDNGMVGGTVFDSATCDSDCTTPVCGDDHVNTTAAEECDPGTIGANVSACDADCTTPACGDNHLNKSFTPPGGTTAEGCDDGDTVPGDGCSGLCQIESCGNGVTEAVNGEECDDGNTDDLDACRNNCQTPRCGDGAESVSEICDEGGDTASCDHDCSAPTCNDGVTNAAAGEQCEDGNTDNGDGCSSTCRLEPFALTVAKAGSGTGTISSNPVGINCGSDCAELFLSGTLVTLNAVPAANATFAGWSGACVGTGACVVTMDATKSVTATFNANRLTVTKTGTGSGTVTGTGITCGIDCSEDYNVGTMVTLTAAPAGDSVFAGWTGGGCSGTGSCVVSMTAATSVNATFALDTYALTVTKAGAGTGTVSSVPTGIDCGTTCSATFTANTLVTLIAAPAGDSEFTGWSGACSGTGSCAVTMTQARAVTATFGLKPVKLTVTASSGGTVTSSPSGINCGNDCNQDYAFGTMVTLTAAPNADRAFVGWGGACTGTGTCTVTMDAAKSVSATFEVNKLTVVRQGDGSGTVTSSPSGINCGNNCTEDYNAGTNVTLTATASSGSTFTGWDGGGCSGTGTCVVTMNGALTVTATFAETDVLTVSRTGSGAGTVTSVPAGISCGGDCSEPYVSGTTVTLTAVATAGSVFTGWSGGGCSGTGTCAVTVTSNTTVTANFEDEFALTVTRAGTGTGTVTSTPAGINCGADCTEAYADNTIVTLTAVASPGSTFAGWSGSSCSGTGTCVVTMSQARSVTATFAVQTFTLTVATDGAGTGTVTSSPAGINCGADCTEDYLDNTSVTLTPTADTGSVFTGWAGACTGSGACTVSMTQARSVTATFAVQTFALDVTLAGTGTGTVTSSPAGISCAGDCSETYSFNTMVTLTAAPTAPDTFAGWTGDCSGASTTCTVTMDAAKAVTATFTDVP